MTLFRFKRFRSDACMPPYFDFQTTEPTAKVLNADCDRRLEVQELNLDSVPEAGHHVELQFACNASLRLNWQDRS